MTTPMGIVRFTFFVASAVIASPLAFAQTATASELGTGRGGFGAGAARVDTDMTATGGARRNPRSGGASLTAGGEAGSQDGHALGSFGTIMIGGADTVLNDTVGVGVLRPVGDYRAYFEGDAADGLRGDPAGPPGADDAIGVRYYYEVGGFEVGVSYQPNAVADRSLVEGVPAFSGVVSSDEVDDQFAVGLNYSGDVGGVSFEFGGGYLTNDEEDQYHIGGALGFGGAAVAGFFNVDENGAGPSEELYGVGALYRSGPFTVGGGYVHTSFSDGGKDEAFVHVGGGYDLAPGVTAYAGAQYGEDGDADGVGGFASIGLKF